MSINCTIRSWRESDAEMLSIICNNKRIQDNLRDGLPYPYTYADALAYIKEVRGAAPGDVFAFAIVIDDRVIGSIGVFRQRNIHRLTAEMGYYMAEECWGNGYMTDAVKQVCEYVFQNSDIIRIFAEPFAYNTGSCRVLEKNGFMLEGLLRKNAIKNGHVLDMKLYAKINPKVSGA